MVLKKKKSGGFTYYSFEASLATAMTTHQTADGQSTFDMHSAVNVLGPQDASFQHWNHIALRKRDDLFAFHSSLFRTEKLSTTYGDFFIMCTHRDATQNHPALDGNIVDADILNTKSFFDIFADAAFNVDDFFGTLKIDVLESAEMPRGVIKFDGNIIFRGDAESRIECRVPAGEKWIVSNKTFYLDKKRTISPHDATVLKWDAARGRYV